MSELTRVPFEKINIGDRFREDYGDIDTLAEDILARGILQPIVVMDNGDGTYELCAGGRRMRAFAQAFEQSVEQDETIPDHLLAVPVHIVSETDELDLREIELIENLLRKDMSWVERVKLQKEIHELQLVKHPKTWSMRQTAKMLMKSPGALSDNLQLAEVIEKFPQLENESSADAARKKFKRALEQAEVTKDLSKAQRQQQLRQHDDPAMRIEAEPEQSTTDYWLTQLDDAYRIGDAIEGMLNSRAGSAHFAEVDPPYGVDLQKEKADGAAGIRHYNEVDASEYEDFLERLCAALYHIMSDDSFVVFWHAPTWSRETLVALRQAGFQVDDIPGIWNKVGAGAAANNPDVYLGRGYEPFFLARKGQPVLRQRGRRNVFDAKPIPAQRKFHPTERPFELIREIIRTLVYPGARVVVPFLGSGNSIIAAYQEGASLVWGWDLAEEYKSSCLVKVYVCYGRLLPL